MTSPVAEPVVTPPVRPASLWEDFMDIFYAPSSVYERRQNQSPWPVILIVSALLLLISFLTYGAISPAVEAELRRQLSKNPQMTQDQIEMGLKMASWTTRLGGLLYPLVIMIAGFFVWIIAKIFGSKGSYNVALVVIGYASIIDVVKAILTGAQALLMDPSSLTSIYKLSTGPARFVDPASASPVMLAILNRLDIFTIWYSVLLGIGVYVTGKVSKANAVMFAIVYWLLPTAFALLGALRQS
jgi:hypothetical protein